MIKCHPPYTLLNQINHHKYGIHLYEKLSTELLAQAVTKNVKIMSTKTGRLLFLNTFSTRKKLLKLLIPGILNSNN